MLLSSLICSRFCFRFRFRITATVTAAVGGLMLVCHVVIMIVVCNHLMSAREQPAHHVQPRDSSKTFASLVGMPAIPKLRT